MPAASRPAQCRFAALSGVAAALALLLVACGPGDPVAEVRELQGRAQFAESLEPLRGLLAERGNDPEVLFLYGRALVRSRQPSLALWSLRKAMEDPEWRVPAGLELVIAELQTGNHERAIETAGGVLEAQPEHLEALLLRARARVSSRRGYEEALADAARALELDAGNVEALVLRAAALLGLERLEEAEATLAELERGYREEYLGSEGAALYCAAQVRFFQEKGDVETAETRIEACLKEFPASPLVVQEAFAFYDERKPERALEVLREALAAAPAEGGYRRALAERLRETGEVAEAERVLREGTEAREPGLALEAWVNLGKHHFELEDYAASASAFERAMELGGRHEPQLLFRYADALVMADRHEEALELAKGMEIPAHRELVRGRVALKRGRFAEALEHFGAGLRLWPDNAVARYYAAQAAEGAGDFERAIAEYRYSIRAGPEATDARLRLARLYAAEGADELALAVAWHDAARHPAEPELRLVAARVAARLGRRAEVQRALAGLADRRARALAAVAEGTKERLGARSALRWLEEVRDLDLEDPRNAEALRAWVSYLAEVGEPERALAAVDAALVEHPEAAALHEIRGRALAATGAPAEAVRAAYARAVELDPEQADALAGLAESAARAGDRDEALALYARAAAADPAAAAPLRAAAELLIALGRTPEAETRLAEALEREPYDPAASARLAALLQARGGEPERALGLARRAARFGGDAGASGETDLARQPAARSPAQ
jgi:tetratricopeptide (TPR) repeat protein